MRKTVTAFLFVLMLPISVWSQDQRPGHFNPLDYGWRDANEASVPLRQTVKAATKYHKETGLATTIQLPSDKKPFSGGPVFVNTSAITFKGGVLDCGWGNGVPQFYIGINDAPLDTKYRGDLSLLDDSVKGRSCFDTQGGTAWLYSQGTMLSLGPWSKRWNGLSDHWREERTLTVEVALNFRTAPPPNSIICGIGLNQSTSYPWTITTGNGEGEFSFNWSTQERRFGPVADHWMRITAPGKTKRLVFTVDLDRGEAFAFDETGQLAVSLDGGAFSGTTFNENLFWPFHVNGGWVGGSASSNLDMQLLGLAVTGSRRYCNRGVGQPLIIQPQVKQENNCWVINELGYATGGSFDVKYQGKSTTIALTDSTDVVASKIADLVGVLRGNLSVAYHPPDKGGWGRAYQIAFNDVLVPSVRADMCDGANLTGQTISDYLRYFEPSQYYPSGSDPYLIANLPFDEQDKTLRYFNVQGGDLAHNDHAIAIVWAPDTFNQVATGVTFDGVEIQHPTPYGACINTGWALGWNVNRSKIRGGFAAVANMPWIANYYNTVNDSELSGQDYALFLYSSLITLRNVGTGATGSNRAFIMAIGSSVNADIVNLGGTGYDPLAIFYRGAGQYAGSLMVKNLTSDNEGTVPYQLTPFYYESEAYTINRFTIENCYVPNVGNVPGAIIKTVPNERFCRTEVEIKGLWTDTTGPIIQSDSGATGFAYNLGGGSTTITGNSPSLINIDTFSRTFPRHGNDPWRANTYTIYPPSPPEGQYRKWILVGDGVIGSKTPPQWRGKDAEPLTAGSVAGSAYDHTAITGAINGVVVSNGVFTSSATDAFSRLLFRNPTPIPTKYYAAPLYVRGMQDGRSNWPYAIERVPVEFTPAVAGVKTITNLTFPEIKGTVGGVAFYDAPQGGTAWIMLNLAEPITVDGAVTVSDVAMSHVPYADATVGAMTTYAWSKLMDGFFNNAPLTQPKWSLGYDDVRVSVTEWLLNNDNDMLISRPGDVFNANALTLPAPPTPRNSLQLFDELGNAWWTIPLTQSVGTVPLHVAPRALSLAPF